MANNKRHRQRAITMLFSDRRGGRGGSGALRDTTGMAPERVFECKTCNRQFPSFQALGGHRASHKKPRLADGEAPIKPKVHGCSICGLEFAVGQALGGHMRRHRVTTADSLEPKDIGKKAAAAAAGLALDLNAPALEEELDDGANLGLTIESPTEDFPR